MVCSISGIFSQPLVGYYNDRCTSRFGRHRPFIAVRTLVVSFAGYLLGNDVEAIEEEHKIRSCTIGVFVLDFWIIDFANNMLQGPCRTLLADLAAGSQSKTKTAYTLYTFFMAIGNVLSSVVGSFGELYKILPCTTTKACRDENPYKSLLYNLSAAFACYSNH
ncbi:hypothetical protein PIB30_006390 [Stylosanthes scabra]|uniref:Uncharacterized protein n=1 Tax=Stylosanthes scabra TaxID=79078 RepID=A0ABU6S446_9FABA|nr:hypothetical protein [Stylosanthes scabra]